MARCGAKERLVPDDEATCSRCRYLLSEAVLAAFEGPEVQKRRKRWRSRIRRKAYTAGTRELRSRHRSEFRELCAQKRDELTELHPFQG